MESFSIFDAQTSFDSLNGGIHKWLSLLADNLAESETSGVLKSLEAEIYRTQDQRDKADLDEVGRGIKNLDNTALEGKVAAAKKHFQPMSDFQVQFQKCYEELENFKKEWLAAAESVEDKLAALTELACAMTVEFYKKLNIPFLKLRVSIKFTCGAGIFNSPMSFEASLDHFNHVVEAIRNEIPDGYPAANFSAFDKSVDDLKALLKRHKDLLCNEDMVRQQLFKLEPLYASEKQPLIDLLALMPDAAKWALFRLMRPDLYDRSAALQVLPASQ